MGIDLEQKILDLGKLLFAKVEPTKDSFFDKDIYLGKMMDWVMQDPVFKVNLFRLVDVLPMLSTTDQIIEHIKEYLINNNNNTSGFINTALKAATLPGAQSLAAKTIKNNVADMAKRFIVGKDIKEASASLKKLSDMGFCFTIDLLGEKTLSDNEAD